jgi:ABC-type multidrug transport system ATPase subunit
MLTISNLSKTYPNGVRALRDVSLEIPNGMFGLIGFNGAGKSTLMRTIATLQEPDEGAIALNGIDVLNDKQKVREVLGYLPQEFGVYPKVSAQAMLDHLALLKGLTVTSERRDEVEMLLRMTLICGRCASRSSAPSRAVCGSDSGSRRRCSATREM